MSFDRLDTTPDKMDAMSGHANRLSSGTRSNNETCSVADPFLVLARSPGRRCAGARCSILRGFNCRRRFRRRPFPLFEHFSPLVDRFYPSRGAFTWRDGGVVANRQRRGKPFEGGAEAGISRSNVPPPRSIAKRRRGAKLERALFAPRPNTRSLGDPNHRHDDHDDESAQARANGDGGDVLIRIGVVQTHCRQHAEHRAGVRQSAADGRGGGDDLRKSRRIGAGCQIGVQEVRGDDAHRTRERSP